MVKLMLEGFGGDQRRNRRQGAAGATPNKFGIACYHVNARLSRNLADIGEFRPQKVLLLIGYCLQAIWCRFRYGVTTFYYIPAPGKRSALVRDWLVMRLCRPFFKKLILHWHATGLGKWLETVALIRTRAITYRLMKGADLSVVLARQNVADAEKLWSQQIKVVNNGIPDPCPNFDTDVLPRRLARTAARTKLLSGQPLTPTEVTAAGGDPQIFKVLFLAHCTRAKGLFDTLDAIAIGNRELASKGSPIRLRLTVAGAFFSESEQAEFFERIARPDLQPDADWPAQSPPGTGSGAPNPTVVEYVGFLSGEAKYKAFAESDCFCFPTIAPESFGLVVIEAMAFGMPVVASRSRALPEILGADYPGLVPLQNPAAVAQAILQMITESPAESLRNRFLNNFTVDNFLAAMAQAIRSLE